MLDSLCQSSIHLEENGAPSLKSGAGDKAKKIVCLSTKAEKKEGSVKFF